ncbi:C6 transcription factor [Fonsecaea pedrosoi]|nr:C6 transcription factor [Fonsecaea pedrosoi]
MSPTETQDTGQSENQNGIVPPGLHHATSSSPQPRYSHGDDRETSSTPGQQTNSPAKVKGPVSLDRLSATDPEAYNQRISSAGLTQEAAQIIDNFSPEIVLESSTSALPGGLGGSQGVFGTSQDDITMEQLLGLELPSKRVTDYFLNTYLDAVHWFMMLFHEPTFRSSYERLMATRRFSRSRSNQVIFILLVLSMGAHYASEDDVRQRFPTFQLQTFRKLSLKKVEDSMHALYDAADLESVQVCVLLGSYYVYYGHPNLAFVVLGAGLRCAQLMLLHRESAWRGLSEIAKEERRRVFWALFIFDRFAATMFGRPCGLSMDEIDIKIPENIGDTTVQHPSFRSTATMPDGTVEPVTTFAYLKYKIKLYQISSPIIGDLYFHRSRSVSELALKVYRIDKELSDFFSSLPPELKLEDLCRNPAEPVTANSRPFILQALALQIAYDNVQILLHRPLLSQDLRNFKTDAGTAGSQSSTYSSGQIDFANDNKLSHRHVHEILLASRDKCWESAIRSSKLGDYRQCLVSARESHAAAFLGINLFTAGMVLCIVALSRPLSSEAQMAKQAVARIMSLSRFLSDRALLSAQTSKILKDLIRLIGEKEIKAMLSESDNSQNMASLSGTKVRDAVGSSAATPGPAFGDPQYSEDVTANPTTTRTEDESVPFTMNQVQTSIGDFDFSGFENIDFNNGLLIMQQAMFPEVSETDMERSNGDGINQNVAPYGADNSYVNQTGGSDMGLLGPDLSVVNTVGQTWLWDSATW